MKLIHSDSDNIYNILSERIEKIESQIANSLVHKDPIVSDQVAIKQVGRINDILMKEILHPPLYNEGSTIDRRLRFVLEDRAKLKEELAKINSSLAPRPFAEGDLVRVLPGAKLVASNYIGQVVTIKALTDYNVANVRADNGSIFTVVYKPFGNYTLEIAHVDDLSHGQSDELTHGVSVEFSSIENALDSRDRWRDVAKRRGIALDEITAEREELEKKIKALEEERDNAKRLRNSLERIKEISDIYGHAYHLAFTALAAQPEAGR